jgi:hypothetical protein
MDFKTIACLVMLMAVGMSTISVSSFTATSQVNMNENGGFRMQLATDATDNISEQTVYVTILDSNGVPVKQICAFEDSENCYLWKTDKNGKVDGFFHVDDVLVMNTNYTIEARSAGVSGAQNFTVLQPRDLSRSVDLLLWAKDNWFWIAVFAFIIAFLIGVVMLFFV